MSYHAVEVGDGGILVGIRVEQHLGVGVDGYVCFDALLVFSEEPGNSLDFRFRLWKGTTVGVITGMEGGALIWGRKYKKRLLSYCGITPRSIK